MTAIRPARAEDAAEATAVAFASKRRWGYAESDIARWRTGLTVNPQQLARNMAFVAVDGGRIVGAIVALSPADDGAAELEHLWVAPGYMGRGLGRRLLLCLCRGAGETGIARLAVQSDPHAEGFYLRCGARRIGAVPAPIDADAARVLPLLQIDVPATARIDSHS